jgi:hypothetical protein
MEETSSDRSLSRRQEKNLLRAADIAARSEFPCPERIGCPDPQTLRLLARRDSSLEPSPDLIDHIATCSPCFVEYSQFRAAHKLRVRVSYALTAAAAVVVLVVISRFLYAPFGQQTISHKETAHSQESLKQIVVDLRPWGAFRSDAPEIQQNRTPLRIPRSRLALSIYLPVGSEEGIYDVALVGPAGQSLGEATGEARLRDFVLVLPVELSVSDLSTGPYELKIRRAQMPWNTYPVLLE